MQFKEAALLTLKIQKFALENGFSLKDASAFNVTYYKGRMIFIDTLSFETYTENQPWRAYKQFVMHFLGPLILAHYHGAENLKLLQTFLDGIPLKMLSSMLPSRSKLSPFLYTNVHLLAKYEAKHHDANVDNSKSAELSKKAQFNLIKSLYAYIKKLGLNEVSEWGNYYDHTNYTKESELHKSQLIDSWVSKINPKTLVDLGGNDGTFVRRLQARPSLSIVSDIDNNAVDQNYKSVIENQETDVVPMVLDLLNPTGAVGFSNKERTSFIKRLKGLKPDCCMALALIHHITLTGNVPFSMSADFFASVSKYLIIEFPKRSDSMVQRLLNVKGDFKAHFDFYSISNFEEDYQQKFEIVEKMDITNSQRVLYVMKRRPNA